ncbi:MAG: nuclear transport factor 2 family protein [Casimicrobiaceae bacterium]
MPPNQVAMGSARDLFAAYVNAFNAQQWNRVVALYSDQPGFRWVENGKVVYTSKQNVADAYAWLHQHVRHASYLPSDTNVTGLSGDTAQVSTRFVARVVTVDGREFAYSGDMRMVLRRENGAWRIAGGEAHSAGDLPPN